MDDKTKLLLEAMRGLQTPAGDEPVSYDVKSLMEQVRDRVVVGRRLRIELVQPEESVMRNAEQVLSYDVIRERVWGYGEAPVSNALTVFVGFLRRKLEAGGRPRLLHNVRGVGYVIRALP